MKLFSYLLMMILFLVSLPVNSKNNAGSVKVDILQIENKDLVVILDSIVDHEKHCVYYNSDLLFSILLLDNRLLIGSIGNRIRKSKSIKGCFIYKNHLFFVEGKSLIEGLFKRTKEKMKYRFAISKSGIDPKTGIMFIDSMDMQNDSYSYWYFNIVNQHLVYDQKSTRCK